MTREDVQRKARALMNTAADGSGATDPERATAARLCNRLLESHGMTEADVPRVAAPRRAPAPVHRPFNPFDQVIITVNVGGFRGSFGAGTFVFSDGTTVTGFTE
jgi:hypothetical protein